MSRIGWERVEDLELKEEEDVGIRNRLNFLRILFVIILGFLFIVSGGSSRRVVLN